MRNNQKYIIGLTGNIGAGKSLVRRMLENLGALGIDADAISHQALAQGAPGYSQTLEYFGNRILDAATGDIDRSTLGRIVFSDPQALKKLENIIHPQVDAIVSRLIDRSAQPVIVIEAIKLLESKLANQCQTTWVADASPGIRQARLVKQRGMSPEDALNRIRAQGDQQHKLNAANIVIDNNGDKKDTWEQIRQAWETQLPASVRATSIISLRKMLEKRNLPYQPAKYEDVLQISSFFKEKMGAPDDQEDLKNRFWDEKFLFTTKQAGIETLLAYQTSYPLTVLNHIWLPGNSHFTEKPDWIGALETAAEFQACKTVLLPTSNLAQEDTAQLQNKGYNYSRPDEKKHRQLVVSSMLKNVDLWYKILNEADR